MPEASWIDVSVPLRAGMVRWPDNPPVEVEQPLHLARGDACTVSTLRMGSHTGTHVDAPAHFVPGGAGVDRAPLDALVGPARVVEIRDPRAVEPAELAANRVAAGERLLLKTRNSARCWDAPGFVEDFVFVSEAAARVLGALPLRCLGVDYLSVAGFRADAAAIHRALLEAGVWIVEGLDLSAVGAGDYDLVCLPLRLQDGDGAPARAILRPRGGPAVGP